MTTGHCGEAAIAGLLAMSVALLTGLGRGADWPDWGHRPDRNMVSAETNLPTLRTLTGRTVSELATSPEVNWHVRLGPNTCGTPTVAEGRVFVGTSTEQPEGGAVVCLDETTGKLLWRWLSPARRFVDPQRPDYKFTANLSSLRQLGVCSSPVAEGGYVYVVSNQGQVVCLRADSDSEPEPVWIFDLWEDERVRARPADTFASSVLIHGDLLYVCTSNGQDMNWGANVYPRPVTRPNPDGPSLIVLEKRTGRLVGWDEERIGQRTFQGQWSSPALAQVGQRQLVVYGGGDGVCYAFEPLSTVPVQPVVLKKVWSCDCNPPEYKVRDEHGQLVDFRLGDVDVKQSPNENDGTYVGLCQIIATPVCWRQRVYVAIGRDPRHGRGRGALYCIDARGSGDITDSGILWVYKGIERTISTVAVAEGLVFAADVAGRLHCLDAETGECYWTHGEESFIKNGMVWASPLVADGKVYFPTRRTLDVLTASKEKQVLATTRLGSECAPVAANGVLYLVSQRHLWALRPAPQEKAEHNAMHETEHKATHKAEDKTEDKAENRAEDKDAE